MHAIIPLESLRDEEQGRIYEVDGDSQLVHRLEEMGFRAGVRIRMVRAGSPCIVQIANQRLSLRTDGTLSILVELDETRVAG